MLAHWAWAHRARLRGCAALELGAGTCLAGLTAAAVGARVTLTDRADAQQVLANAAAAAARNGLSEARCRVLPLTWGDFTPQLVALPPQDVLLGADVLYDSTCFEPLLATVAFLLRRGGPGCTFVTAYQQRSRHASLEWRLQHWVRRRAGSGCATPADGSARPSKLTCPAFVAAQGLECVAVTPAEEVLPAGVPLREVVHVVELRLQS